MRCSLTIARQQKYEHLIPIFARIEDSKKIKGALIIINTIGGDVASGACAC